MIFSLLAKKDAATYKRLWQQLKILNPNLTPSQWLIDYEMAAKTSLEEEFPDCEVKGCLFHKLDCYWRAVQRNGLQTRYCNDPDFQLTVRKFLALAFVPIPDILESFNILVNSLSAEHGQLLANFITYVQVRLKCLTSLPSK